LSTSTFLIVAGAFLASAVERVEALTIVLGVGVVRGWRSTLVGVAAAAGVAVGLGLTALVAHEGVDAWWLLPAAGAVLLAESLRRAATLRRSEPGGSE
jgi:Ca2+/H+ antiporter, TMEM165/GDT1 family